MTKLRRWSSECLRGLNVRKSPGPENIGGRVLKQCAAQLSGGFCSLFQRSMDTQVLWKTAVSHPSSYKDHRPIGLTSLLGKSLEQIIKTHSSSTPVDMPLTLDSFPTDLGGGQTIPLKCFLIIYMQIWRLEFYLQTFHQHSTQYTHTFWQTHLETSS